MGLLVDKAAGAVNERDEGGRGGERGEKDDDNGDGGIEKNGA